METFTKIILGFVLGYIVVYTIEKLKAIALIQYAAACEMEEDGVVSMFAVDDDLEFIYEEDED